MENTRQSLSKTNLLAGRDFSSREKKEAVRGSKALNDFLSAYPTLTAAAIGALTATTALSLLEFVGESPKINSLNPGVIAGAVGAIPWLIMYGWRNYSSSPAMELQIKEENNLTSTILKGITREALYDSIGQEALSVTVKSLQSLIKDKMFESAYPYRNGKVTSIAAGIVKAGVKLNRPFNVLNSLAQAWFSPKYEKITRMENFFSQHTRFDVNIANLALHMSVQLGVNETQKTLSIYDENVLKLLNSADDILPFFAKNEISLKTMLHSLQKAIGPDAAFLFDEKHDSPKDVYGHYDKIMARVQEMVLRQSQIHNIGQTLLDMYSAMLSGDHSEFTPETVKFVVRKIQAELHKELESFKEKKCKRDPARPFKYQSLLDACQNLLKDDLSKKLSDRRDAEGADAVAFAFKKLFPKDNDANSPMHPRNGSVKDLKSEDELTRKTQQHTYAVAMSDAIKSLLRESKVILGNVIDNSPSSDAFMDFPDAVNSITKRIMQRVFIHSQVMVREVPVVESHEHLKPCREEDCLTRYKP